MFTLDVLTGLVLLIAINLIALVYLLRRNLKLPAREAAAPARSSDALDAASAFAD